MNALNFTNDLGECKLTGNLICNPTTDPACDLIPSGTPATFCEPVLGTFCHMDDVTEFRGIVTVTPSEEGRSFVYVENLDDPNLNFYLGSRWTDLELTRAGIFGTVTVS